MPFVWKFVIIEIVKIFISTILAIILFPYYIYSYPVEDVYKLTGKDYFPEVKRLLGEAKKSIYVSLYMAMYNPKHRESLSNQLIDELAKAKKRGVTVKVILDQGRITSTEQYNDMAYNLLQNAGVEVSYDTPSQKLHDKLVIIDDNIVIIGSHNWSSAALKENSETSVVIKSPEIAGDFIKWFQSIRIAPRHTPPPKAESIGIYLPYQFLTNPKLAVNFSDHTMKLYLFLLKKWNVLKCKPIVLNYLTAATLMDLDKYSRRVYRRRVNYFLYILRDRYKLISVKTGRRKPAIVELLDYNNSAMPLNPDPLQSFLIPGGFWEFGWLERLSFPAKYFYFIGLIETGLSQDPKRWWSHNQRYLIKKYHLAKLSTGIVELNRYNLLAVEYGLLMPPFKEYLEAPKYLQLPLYSWEWHKEQIKNLESLYGKKKVAKARHWAEVVLEENNLDVIEKLINYSNEYGEAMVRYAVNKVARKRIGNRKRSFVYIEGIILKRYREEQGESED